MASAVLLVGMLGYMLIEGYSWIDGLYMSVITLSTVGYETIHPLSTGGKLFSVGLILFGLGLAFYTVGVVAAAMIEGWFLDFMRGRRMDSKISKLEGHTIVCGYGRVGQWAAHQLRESSIVPVVVEKDEDRLSHAQEAGYHVLAGDATEDAVLERAGIDRALALLCALGDDPDNVFLTLSAKGLAPDILVVARASDEGTESKLRRAGADRVISLHETGGMRMAYLVHQPAVVDFLDVVVRDRSLDLRLGELRVPADSSLVGTTLRDCRIREDTGTMIIAVRRGEQQFEVNPDPARRIEAADVLIVLGQESQIQRLIEANLGVIAE